MKMPHINIEDHREHFLEYFRLFRDNAPKAYVEYAGFQHGLPTGMAASLESIIAFTNKVYSRESIILNAGSGVSSWVLRKIFPNVIDTDPDKDYMNSVKDICELGGLSTDNFIPLSGILRCDYCFYDYGNIERLPNMEHAISITNDILYIDDTDDRIDCIEARQFTLALAQKLNLTTLDCPEAKDEWGRWGMFIYKN